jgi:hypothetical protein
MKPFIILASGVLALAVILSGFTITAALLRAVATVHFPRYHVMEVTK